jgi:glycosyltransferase involved in cell wall biosynthesis
MAPTVLHVLSQRPLLTGSGVTLDSLVNLAARAGWQQHVVVGQPIAEPPVSVGGLRPSAVHALAFGGPELDFVIPGMSDVMPYESTCFSCMSPAQLDHYRQAWHRHLAQVIAEVQPDLIHSHHIWIVSSILKDIAADIPVVTQCHATGFRQLALCPHLADEIISGCARNERFFVLHAEHARTLADTLGVSLERIHVVGAGYRKDLFHASSRGPSGSRLLYVGKYSRAKGLPWLLDAVESLSQNIPDLQLHVAGSGGGGEASELEARMQSMAQVHLHGQLNQAELGDLMRQSSICVLPSFFEGLPLVLVEALACGCRLVATALPGIKNELEPHLGQALDLVALPRLSAIDTPLPEDLPAFVDNLSMAIEGALAKPPLGDPSLSMPGALAPFRWQAVFERVQKIWKELIPRA